MAQTNLAWRTAIRQWRGELREVAITKNGGASESTVIAVAQLCPRLERLQACEYDDVMNDENATKEALQARGPWFLMTDKSAAKIAEHCPKLQGLFAFGLSGQLTDLGFAKLCAGCPLLREVDLESSLDMYPCEASVKTLAAGLAAKCPMLRTLKLHTPDTKQAPSNEELLALARRCSLEELAVDVDGSTILASTLLELAAECSFQVLQLQSRIPMRQGFLPITDDFILALVQKSPRLKGLKLDLADDCSVTEAAWTTLARKCQFLEDINCGVEFSDDIVREFAKSSGIRPYLTLTPAGYRMVDGKRKRVTRWVADKRLLLSRSQLWEGYDHDGEDGDETLSDADEHEHLNKWYDDSPQGGQPALPLPLLPLTAALAPAMPGAL